MKNLLISPKKIFVEFDGEMRTHIFTFAYTVRTALQLYTLL